MKIGILGGTFNPVHLGHLIMAQTVAKKFKLEQILFIPCAVPYHKKNIRLANARHRLKMVRLAVARTPHFAGSDIDLKDGSILAANSPGILQGLGTLVRGGEGGGARNVKKERGKKGM